MSKYKGLRIATVAGKGSDGCGVQRTSAELQLWAEKVGAIANYYAYDVSFSRSDAHDMNRKIFTQENLKETGEYINDNYDIVMIMNYPTNKHDHEYAK